jgi:hypothetical protein
MMTTIKPETMTYFCIVTDCIVNGRDSKNDNDSFLSIILLAILRFTGIKSFSHSHWGNGGAVVVQEV